MRISRRNFAAGMAASFLVPRAFAQTREASILTRAIPRCSERLPCVGLGAASVFDSNGDDTRRSATQVVHALVGGGGRLIDTASTYGDAEIVLGSVITSELLRRRFFIATKLDEPDEAELKRSLGRLRTSQLDLLQLHNVRDPRQSLARFRAWKAQCICRYIGITFTYHSDFDAVAAVLENEKPDFVQIDYSIDDRAVEGRILPLATEFGAGVLTALPFGRGRLFRAVRGKLLPDWATGFAGSWAQFFLKWLLADERVTVVIPGTSSAEHMGDNLGAMRGRLPDREERARMLSFVSNL